MESSGESLGKTADGPKLILFDINDEDRPIRSLLRHREPLIKYENFLRENGEDSSEQFWKQAQVVKRVSSIWEKMEGIEESACSGQIMRKTKIPPQILSVATIIGVSPEMIGDKVGQEVLFARKLTKNKMKLAPNGVQIAAKPTYDEYINNECGTVKQFFEQAYVQQIIRDAQLSKLTRPKAAEMLGIAIPRLIVQIKKLNKQDNISDYEKSRQSNIADRVDLFGKMNFADLKQALKERKFSIDN